MEELCWLFADLNLAVSAGILTDITFYLLIALKAWESWVKTLLFYLASSGETKCLKTQALHHRQGSSLKTFCKNQLFPCNTLKWITCIFKRKCNVWKLPSKAHILESFGEPRRQGYPDTNEIWAKCFFMMKYCHHVTDQIVKRWWRYEEERLQIGVAFVRTLEKKNERLSKSLMFIWYFLLFAFVHGVDSDYIREVHGGFNFLSEKNPTFSYLPVSAHTKEVWGRLAAWNWENQCCMGRQSEGSTWRGAEDRMLLHNSWAFLAARVHFPVRTPAHNMPQQCRTRKCSVSA